MMKEEENTHLAFVKEPDILAPYLPTVLIVSNQPQGKLVRRSNWITVGGRIASSVSRVRLARAEGKAQYIPHVGQIETTQINRA